jgi:hypothetical protein
MQPKCWLHDTFFLEHFHIEMPHLHLAAVVHPAGMNGKLPHNICGISM